MAYKGNFYNGSSDGKVMYNKNIMLSIINLSAKEISGVSCLCSRFGSRIKKLFSSNYFEGVKVNFSKNNTVDVDVYIKVYFGYSVSDVAYRVQENIKNGISSMMDIKIGSINVHVLGVDFSKEELVKSV
ncbi:MAG: Asp23/Gls24 family envelope stress response protein [Christensenellaceae bacterium]|jgi:uncharacterized alkaline shock family protein YloU|nr:Asp23/Gls24 family envelope stress response protein [Christensenellaceae bacterium]